MKQTGHISITDKVRFVYWKLPQPSTRDYNKVREYEAKYAEYLASKREVEVDNYAYRHVIKRKYPYIHSIKGVPLIKHNQPCEAEVTDGKATITKIL